MNTSGSQQKVKSIDPFRKSTKRKKDDFFDVDFEDSQGYTASTYTLSQNSDIEDVDSGNVFKKPKSIGANKNKVEDPFDVDFEESKEASSQNLLSSQQTESQKSSEVCSQDTTINFKKPNLFKNPKLHSNNTFDIDFEESGQILTQNSQQLQASSTSSQKSVGELSQGETKKPSLFQNRKRQVNNAFEVEYEESRQNDVEDHSQNSQLSPPPESDKENVEDTLVNFEKADPFREAKQQRRNKPFAVDFEESRNITNILNTSRATPTNSRVVPFRKSNHSAKEEDFDVNFNETDSTNNTADLTDKSGQVMSSASPISGSHSFTSGPNPKNTTTATASDFNQSSFNDENLLQWMSDQSEDDMAIETGVIDVNARKTLPPDDIRPDIEQKEDEIRPSIEQKENEIRPEIGQKEDNMQTLQLKLKEIIENARNGKVQVKSHVKIPESCAEKPKKLQNKRKVTWKPTLKKPAPFATKRLYNHLITKIKPKYGIDSVVHAEELVIYICDVVKTVIRRKAYQKKLINDLKMEMAKMGVIKTTYQFYEFIREFLPYDFRLKSIPCIQPGTNIVYPPKDAINPFQKIL